MKKRIETSAIKDANTIEIEVKYDKGGYNCFTGKNEPRGIYLHVSPITVTPTDYGESVSYMCFTGIKYFVKELGRKSQKQEGIAWNKVEPHCEEIARMFENDDKKGIFDLLCGMGF